TGSFPHLTDEPTARAEIPYIWIAQFGILACRDSCLARAATGPAPLQAAATAILEYELSMGGLLPTPRQLLLGLGLGLIAGMACYVIFRTPGNDVDPTPLPKTNPKALAGFVEDATAAGITFRMK